MGYRGGWFRGLQRVVNVENDEGEDRKKNWKFRAGDLDDRALWTEYTAAYRDAIAKCSTKWAPWYIVPADDEDARDLLVSRAIADALDGLDLGYPALSADLEGLKIE